MEHPRRPREKPEHKEEGLAGLPRVCLGDPRGNHPGDPEVFPIAGARGFPAARLDSPRPPRCGFSLALGERGVSAPGGREKGEEAEVKGGGGGGGGGVVGRSRRPGARRGAAPRRAARGFRPAARGPPARGRGGGGGRAGGGGRKLGGTGGAQRCFGT